MPFWLRSRGNNNNNANAANVNNNGNVNENGNNVNNTTPAVGLALNLNQKSVIFVSKAAESGQSGAAGAKEGAVGAEAQKFVLPTGYSNEYKLTMQGDHDGFSITNKPTSLKKSAGSEIELEYTGAKSGANEYVSMILTQEKAVGNLKCDEVKYYGKLVKVDSSSLANGKLKIKLPTGLEAGVYKLKIFAEQCNGDKKTDWASATQDINLTVGEQELKVNEFEVSPIAHRAGYEQEVKATLKGQDFDLANKLVVEFVDENDAQALAHETGISSGETEKTITFSASDMASLPTGHYKIKELFYDNNNAIINELTYPDVYHVVGEQTISDIEREPAFLKLPFDSATIKVKFKLNGLEDGDTIVSGAAIFTNAAGDEITSAQALVPNGLQPDECLVNDLVLPRLEAGSYKIKGIMNFNHHDVILQSSEIERDFEIKPEHEPEPSPTPIPTPTPVPTPVPDPYGGNDGGFSWNVAGNDDASASSNPTPTPTDQTGTIGTKTLKDIQSQLPEKVKTVGYIKGYEDGTFKPERNITRAEAVQMLYKLIYNGTRVNYDALKKFSDVNQTAWYSTAVAYLADQGLIDGDGGKFYPNRQITRAEMSKILYNALLKYDRIQDKKLTYGTTQFNFTDIPNNWMLEPIKQLATNNMIDGYGDGTFKPNNNITRAESVAMIAKVFDRSQDFSQRVSFKDVSQSHWAYKYIMNAVNGEN